MYKKIMVAMDGKPSSKQALVEGIKLARLCAADLFVVFVVDRSTLFAYGGRMEPEELLDDIRHYGESVLGDAIRSISSASVRGEKEIIETDVGQDVPERLQRYVVDNSINLAVIGTHGRRGVRRLVLGSVAERFLRGSTCPVLLVRGNEVARAPSVSA
ncbi:universal stress protein [Burkholderia cenocepacia]|uniref:Universal stress protein UspA n=1 Tax=Burkholderia cenocepacia TaxID=95486 RepID=A0A1V2VTF1_9BURK|nr:universal stress protein [Burkholderia cenocepacia]MBR8285410.1 universal stress protein [Burkholderia cenocepacia]MBR8497035.1 universal stress protein [Burkholderia cenocepacia]NDV73416.1 universal stress protein [Burkholderia cenocepacia]ONI98657.1 universal stress protein UspA [Burkholderia cenocepacia]ONJ21238.1 universal stress protein UspA [Burkholderia cenocepacia]